MSFYMVVLRRSGADDVEWEYRIHVAFERNVEIARNKAKAGLKGYDIVTVGMLQWWQFIYALPIFRNVKLKGTIK